MFQQTFYHDANRRQDSARTRCCNSSCNHERRLQDVPQSIQAFSTEQIEKLGLDNMAQYVKAIPSLSTVTTSPGRNEVVFRGVSTGTGEWRIDSSSAVFLGDIPMTSATQAVDPRTVDVARIESLPGPQSILFGASAQCEWYLYGRRQPGPQRRRLVQCTAHRRQACRQSRYLRFKEWRLHRQRSRRQRLYKTLTNGNSAVVVLACYGTSATDGMWS